ncbi:iron complex transport system ATP-binding protein [Geodermatophilus pulveris]|uniref:Iron complex transport system ATP-binding protein n=1 Tax=Geodermatophilus pulveris TaxID=1564159 RepID=A0A239BAQ0_9ACTN|nr:ABC transporter ATP-binding protein [Geodermatophilus pulveris]SNS05056.1 iron complex transport system ATP-binding protein [Geodermatophilus pulveris]
MGGVSSEPVVEMHGVDVVRGQSHLLRGIDWTVLSDQRWVVLGPNGAGKTTLLQLAGAHLHPTRGEVALLGETLGAVDVFELRPRIGLTSAALAQRLQGGERAGDVVLSAGYAVVGRGRERYDVDDLTRAAALMHQWGVTPMAHRPFGTLSEGERKRVQIARALMPDPELLLLDEPGAGLDLGGREDLVSRLTDLARSPSAPAQVLVTHHVEEIPPGYTHALLLRDGGVVAAGPLEQVVGQEALSETFGLALSVQRSQGRWTARRAA